MEMIRFENVTRTYQIGDCVLNALDGVNAFSEEGIFVVIHRGLMSGKSTFLNWLGEVFFI
ncbi:MAG: hypothetical protein KH380_02725 [Coprobacillus sp.]|nr:hypothetical protein [Coprobacillus sp.]